MIQTVINHSKTTETVTMMEYGNGWRVKRVVTEKDEGYSRLVESSDNEYSDYDKALSEYIALV